MSPSDPQFLYMILVLPSLFGLALIGEGINKVVHEEWAGLISITFGLVFISIVIFTFLFFSSYFGRQI
jgi:hypothetical protein